MLTGLSASQWVLLFTLKKNTIDFNVSQFFQKKKQNSKNSTSKHTQFISLNLQINELNFRTYPHNRHFY